MNQVGRIMFPAKGNNRTGKSLDRVMFVDPGLQGTGWAFFNRITAYRPPQVRRDAYVDGVGYEDSGVYFCKGRQWEGRSADICAWFRGVINAYSPRIVVIEMPSAWSGSAISMSSVASGDLFKLTYLVGGLGQVVIDCGCRLPVLIKPAEWKGQLPKNVVIKRIRARIPRLKPSDHEADAIGMGLSAQGLL